MSGKSVDSCHLSPHECEDTPVEEAMAMLVLKDEGEVGVFKRVQLSDYHQAPEPVERVINHERVNWK